MAFTTTGHSLCQVQCVCYFPSSSPFSFSPFLEVLLNPNPGITDLYQHACRIQTCFENFLCFWLTLADLIFALGSILCTLISCGTQNLEAEVLTGGPFKHKSHWQMMVASNRVQLTTVSSSPLPWVLKAIKVMFVFPYTWESSSKAHVSTLTAYNYNAKVTVWVLETVLNRSALT